MAQGLQDLLTSNKDISQYFLSLPTNVQNAVTGSGEEICTLEDLLRLIQSISGTC